MIMTFKIFHRIVDVPTYVFRDFKFNICDTRSSVLKLQKLHAKTIKQFCY